MKSMKTKNISVQGRFTIALLMSLVLLIAFCFSGIQPNFMFGSAASEKHNYFTADYDSKGDALAAGKKLNEEIYGEGVTLLKNENNALPLASAAKISLFGKNSSSILTGGSGSGNGSGGEMVSIQTALKSSGFELNPSLVNFYRDSVASGTGRGIAPSNGNITSGYNTGETPVSMYTPTIEATYANYSDAALVVFSRISGEGFDLPRTMTWNGSNYGNWGNTKVPGARNSDDHYLQLDQNESDLLKYLGGKFNKVIVMLNTGSQFECGFLDDPTHYGYHENIKAALWIGYPGGTGLNALGKILKGEINPSGKTVDTYARNFKNDPTWKNFGNNLKLKGNQYTNLSSSEGNGGGGYRNNYVNYKEGIYVGYRYYETRSFTEKNAVLTAKPTATEEEQNAWYKNSVIYPFGYGLSYTTFTQSIINKVPAANAVITDATEINITVKVTNTGSVAGKDIVELYYTAPYIENGIEKSHVVLGAFAKTGLLAPNASEDVVLTLKARDMASYDFNDANKNSFKGYELDAGAYSIKIMKNSHEVVDSVDYSIASTIKCDKDSATGNAVANRFDDVSSEIDVYMTRANWETSFPTTTTDVAASDAIKRGVAEWLDNKPADAGKPYYSDTKPTVGTDVGELILENMIGLPYDDPKWEKYLDQFSKETMKSLVTNGSYSSGINVPALGLTSVVNADGPAGWVNWSNGTFGASYTFYGSETILASTWNQELAKQKGIMMGNEGLFGNGNPYSKFPGFYAPAVNIHRSPFSGRNFEYYSEDGLLTGMMAANFVAGAKEKGLFCYVKHFGVNDQETNRCGLMTWANEQSMREIYFKGFELCVKVGKTTGIMSGLNRIGTVWAGGNYQLLTEVLRNEWGFKGTVVTDTFLGGGLSEVNQMIRAGGDLALGVPTIDFEIDSATTLTAVRKAAHNICYTHANSMAMNTKTMTKPQVMNPYVGGVLAVGIIDVAYNENLGTATVNEEALGEPINNDLFEYTIESGELPGGLTLSTKGILSGTPTEEVNNRKFTVQAKYKTYTKTADFIISVIDPNGSIIYQITDPLSAATIGAAYTGSVATARIYKPDETEGDIAKYPPIEYALKNASYLPEGLTLSSKGEITGTPTKECRDYEFTVVATALGYKAKDVTCTISIFNSLVFTSKALPAAKFGVSYVNKIQPATSEKSVTYRLKNGSELPKGLTLTENGYIVGTPIKAVTDHEFTVEAIADFSITCEAVYKITVGIAYNETIMPDGKARDYYDASISFAQGSANIKYTVKEGSVLPEGLVLAEDGTITGTPTKAGVYDITFVASGEGLVGDETTVKLYIANGDKKTGCNSSATSGGVMMFATIALLLGGVVICRKKRSI